MRTPLPIDDDVLTKTKSMAARQHKSVGECNGIVLLPGQPESAPVTLEIINQLRDELP